MKRRAAAIAVCLTMLLMASCGASPAVSAGRYYLGGNKDGEYIQIIDGKALRFVGFDIEYLSSYLVTEGTDYSGDEAEAFMARQNLPDVFNGEIEYEYDADERTIYVHALTNNDVDFFVVNYRMTYSDKNTIIFMQNTYTRR